MLYIKQFFITVVVFFLVDIFWLAFVAKNLYRKYIGFIMTDSVNVWAAALFYIVYIIGLIHFVIRPGLMDGDMNKLILNGMFFGFITYATYDLTNLATLRDWPIMITIVDIVWGTILCGAVSTISYIILR